MTIRPPSSTLELHMGGEVSIVVGECGTAWISLLEERGNTRQWACQPLSAYELTRLIALLEWAKEETLRLNPDARAEAA